MEQSPRIALAGGDGSSTVVSVLRAEHAHGRGLFCFFSHDEARRALAPVCAELRREVAAFAFPVVILRGHRENGHGVCALDDGLARARVGRRVGRVLARALGPRAGRLERVRARRWTRRVCVM